MTYIMRALDVIGVTENIVVNHWLIGTRLSSFPSVQPLRNQTKDSHRPHEQNSMIKLIVDIRKEFGTNCY
jgi:hypothetical protein